MEQTTLHKKSSTGRIVLAILLVGAGLLLLGFNLGWIPMEYKSMIFSWPSLLLVLGVMCIIIHRWFSGFVLITLGTLFMLRNLGIIEGDWLGVRPLWPIMLVIIGVSVLLKKRRPGNCPPRPHRCGARKEKEHNTADYIEKNIMFNSGEYIVFSTQFKGGDVNVAFGEVKLDLRKLTGIAPDNLFEANVMFGSLTILLPPDVELDLKSSTMFGHIEDQRQVVLPNSEAAPATVLHLKGNTFFANIIITH